MRIEITDKLTTRELRRSVLRPSWPADAQMHGDDNPDAVHFAAFDDDGTLVAACLVLPRDFPARPAAGGAWQLRGMATAEGRRSTGIGAQLLAAAVDEVRRRGGRLLWCEARSSAMRFYARHGFTVDGGEYAHSETGIPHHLMWRELGAEPRAHVTSST
ncbi:MAG TPA: GNAT family N-acetyltransferase [Jatrophihabitans sp.]|nr:GNAT family N-acetyltransferase [Jatrophihabitans sp.]